MVNFLFVCHLAAMRLLVIFFFLTWVRVQSPEKSVDAVIVFPHSVDLC